MSAVLPPCESWPKPFHSSSSQNSNVSKCCSFSTSKNNSHLFSDCFSTGTKHKRKFSDDDSMSISDSEYDEVYTDENNYNKNNINNNNKIKPIKSKKRLCHSHSNIENLNNGKIENENGNIPLKRILETLSKDEIQNLVVSLCTKDENFESEILKLAPKLTPEAALEVLKKKINILYENFPYKCDPSSDYTYNRVRNFLLEYFSALSDFTPQFLPPKEHEISNSLYYLDEATSILHTVPKWDSINNNYHTNLAYHDLSLAWIMVIKEASKRASSLNLLNNGIWYEKLLKHNEKSKGKLKSCVDVLNKELEWLNPNLNQNQNQNQNHIDNNISSNPFKKDLNPFQFRLSTLPDTFSRRWI